MNQTMSDDIPQDQVEAVSRTVLETMRNEVKRSIFNDVGVSQIIAIAAIRVLTPMIAAVERERCAALVEDFPWQLPLYDSYEANVATDDAVCSVVTQIAARIRSVKGAVT